jgi:hypoxanthine-DNA glycosylase
MKFIQSFPPVSDGEARVLILGTIPGKMSLAQQQYYANPQNAFWRIMGALTGTSPELPYEQRLQALVAHRIALWDVLASCVRMGSLDVNIKRELANDFTAFFATHPHIRHVFFNGAKAELTFRKWVAGKQNIPELQQHRLPSTSSANAGKDFEGKLAAWGAVVRG